MRIGIENVSKAFPGVKALDDVSLELAPGEIHAVMGENGAGKSTLIKIITGLYRPDTGRVVIDGKEVVFSSPRDAIAAGISAVHQERNLIPRFSVGENILLERPADPERTRRLRRHGRRGASLSRPARPWHRHARRSPHAVGCADADRRDRQGAVSRGEDACCSTSRPPRSPNTRRPLSSPCSPSCAPMASPSSSSATSSRRSSPSPTA